MIKIYDTKVFPFLEEDTFFTHRDQIEKRRQKSILDTGSREGKARSLAAGVLLHRGLCEYLGLLPEKTPPFQTLCGEWGKPYLAEYPGIHFNISHSGEHVCCAISDSEVGVDIQRHQKVKATLAGRFFTGEDNRLLDGCAKEEREECFFRIWSIRESYLKFTGRGLGQGLSTFGIDWKNSAIRDQGRYAAYFEENREMEGYSLCVCSEKKERDIQWILAEERG